MSPNKDRTSKCGAYKKSDHNLVVTRFKNIWSKCANSETMTATCISRVYTAVYYNGRYFFLFGKPKWKLFDISFESCKNAVDSRYLEYSISRFLIAYLRQFIWSIGHLALDQSKKLVISNLDISNFSLCRRRFPLLWVVFSRTRTFPKISKTFCSLSTKLAFFQLPLGQLLQLCQQEWVKTLKSSFFCSFFDWMIWPKFFIARIFNKGSL